MGEVGKIVGLHAPEELHELRIDLVKAVQSVFKTLRFAGGFKPSAQKRSWRKKAITYASKLSTHLDEVDLNISAGVRLSADGDGVILTPAPDIVGFAHKMQNQIEELVQILNEIDEAAARTRNADSNSKEVDESENYGTGKAEYQQVLVLKLAHVFRQHVGREEIKRNTDGQVIIGVFPDFIKAAADPYLKAFHHTEAKAGALSRNLDREIQAAVKKLGPKR